MKRGMLFLLAVCLLCLICGCKETPVGESPEGSEPVSGNSEASEAFETVSVPALALLYEESLTAKAISEGCIYTYKFCFDEEHLVFNAEAVIEFPYEAWAKEEYLVLAEEQYPNLVLDGQTLSFAFPKKECPYYGISFEVLPYLLENTIYEIVEVIPATEESAEE